MEVQGASEQLLHLKLAFLAGEPPACVLTLARYAALYY
jgi:protein-lysine N-methyltransferase EEF2KMT